MTVFSCEICKKNFNRKSTYDNHLARKNPCKPDNYVDNQCSFCDKKYSTKFNLNKHYNNCTKKIIADDNKLQIEELKKKFEEQQKKIEELTKLSETNHHNINVNENSHNTTNNTTNNNNITIYNIGKEDLTRLSKEDIIKICTSGTFYPQVAAEVIHCNEKYPEFQNFLISNLRSNTGLIRDNDNWVSKSNDDILRAILKVDKKHVSTLIKDLKVDEKLQIRLEITKDEVDTNESKQHQAAKIKTILYNASKMVTKNKKKTDKLTNL
jgi:hypothetical protein